MDPIQQLQVVTLHCNRLTHNAETIKSICLRVGCKEQCSQCHMCMLELHNHCIDSTKMLKDLPQLLQPLSQMQSYLIDLQQNINYLMKELIDSTIEQFLQPIKQYKENPNLTNLNKLGLFLKDRSQFNVGNKLEKLENNMKKLFQDCKERINFKVSMYEYLVWKMNDKSAEKWFNEGIALYGLNKLQEAIDCYQQAINLDPNNTIINNNIQITKQALKK